MPLTLSLVLPCYNEEANIEQTVRSVSSWFDREQVKGEIIVVNDGSKDRSLDVLRGLTADIPSLKIVNLATNQGYGRAIRGGCDVATQDIIAFMDSDGQFHAEDLSVLLAHIEEYAFVTGRRRKRADSFIRNMYGKVLGLFILLTLSLWVRDVNCGMKAFRSEIWKIIRPTRGVEKLFNTEIFLRLKQNGIPWYQVDVPHYPRTAGQPTGTKISVILRMFRELWALKRLDPSVEIASR